MGESTDSQRIFWIDTIRFIAMMWVFTVHFIATYNSDLFYYWRNGISQYILMGITGKLAVAMFTVLLGYFAAAKSTSRPNLTEYTANRYFQFASPLLIVNSIIVLLAVINTRITCFAFTYNPDVHNVKNIISDSFLFNTQILPTFWCIRPFFISSVLIVVLNKEKCSILFQLLAMTVIIYSGYPWIGICIMGSILYKFINSSRYSKMRFFYNRFVQLAVFLVAAIMIKRQESTSTYVIDGIACALVLTIIFYNQRIQRIFSCKSVSRLGRVSLYIYLLHVPIYSTIGKVVLSLASANNVSYQTAFWASYVCCFVANIILSIGLEKCISLLNTLITRITKMIKERTGSICSNELN